MPFCNSGPRIATAEEQLTQAQTPPKRFISLEYQRPNDLKPWGVTLQQPQPQEPASDSEDDYSGTLEETHVGGCVQRRHDQEFLPAMSFSYFPFP